MVARSYTRSPWLLALCLANLVFFLLIPGVVCGELLALWEFENTEVATGVASHLSAADVSLSSGSFNYQDGSDDGGSWIGYASTWTTNGFSTGGKYIQFSIAPDSGYKVLVTNASVRLGRTLAGPVSFTAQYSVDDFTTTGNDAGTGTIVSGFTDTLEAFGLVVAPGVQSAGVTCRIWGHNAGGAGNLRFNNFRIYGTVIKPEPSNQAGALVSTLATHRTIILGWADADGAVLPDGYLVRGSRTGFAEIPVPVDAQSVPNYYTWSSGLYARSIDQGLQAVELKGLAAGSTYYFKLFPFSNRDGYIDYKLDGTVPQIAVTTGSAPFEDFEDVAKSAYGSGDVVLKCGSWRLDNALLGGDPGDRKADQMALRIRNQGCATMLFDVFDVEAVLLDHANYGSDGGGGFVVERSLDAGTTWVQVDAEVACGGALQTSAFRIHRKSPIRLRIRKTVLASDVSRINIDNIRFTPYIATSSVFRFY